MEFVNIDKKDKQKIYKVTNVSEKITTKKGKLHHAKKVKSNNDEKINFKMPELKKPFQEMKQPIETISSQKFKEILNIYDKKKENKEIGKYKYLFYYKFN
jgi:hypothetical protein